MIKKHIDKDHPVQKVNQEDTDSYPLYPANEDIYIKFREEKDINPEDVSYPKYPDESIEYGETDDKSGSDLDIPGSEADDDQENIGSEDEENNYYSLGGDEHNDLDEDKGD